MSHRELHQAWSAVCGLSLLLVTSIVFDGSAAAKELQAQKPPAEISGIVVYRDNSRNPPVSMLAFVSNAREGAGKYFRSEVTFPLDAGEYTITETQLLDFDQPGAGKASDLEDVALLNDHVVVLSEDTSCLVSRRGVVADYSGIPELQEVDRHYGLEGLAIRSLDSGRSRVAVLFEGGSDKAKGPRSPRLFMHDISSSSGTLKVKLTDGELVKLQYDGLCKLTGEQRPTVFRSPALVWWELQPQQWGFVVLLSVDDPSRYHKKWLARFNSQGQAVGTALPFTALGMSKDLAALNWEGMCWSSESEAFILVDDATAPAETTLLVIPKPTEW